jgi:hypothetical protein
MPGEAQIRRQVLAALAGILSATGRLLSGNHRNNALKSEPGALGARFSGISLNGCGGRI